MLQWIKCVCVTLCIDILKNIAKEQMVKSKKQNDSESLCLNTQQTSQNGLKSGMNPKEIPGSQKDQLWLIPPEADRQEAKVLLLGAAKYGPWNWREDGIKASTYISAVKRHLAAWAEGEDTDPESGVSHLAHIRANVSIVLDAIKHGKMIDDRAK